MYLKYELEDDTPYSFFLLYHKTSSSEFYSDDGLEHNLPSIGPIPSGCFAGLGRIRSGADIRAMQAKVDYPLFLDAGRAFKEIDGVFNDHYIEVPIVFNGDLLTRYTYEITHYDGVDIVNHAIYTDADWENFYGIPVGSFDLAIHGGTYHQTLDITDSRQNPGILYLIFPYSGPLPGDPDFETDHFYADAQLNTKVNVGGSVPQNFPLGQCVRAITRDTIAGDYTSYLKLSIVRDSDTNGSIEKVEGYKSVVYDMANMSGASEVDGLYARITLTTPLDRSLSFVLDLEPAFSTETPGELVSSLTRMRDEFGLINHEGLIMSITPTPAGIPTTEFGQKSVNVTIPAGQQSALVPLQLKRPVNGRYSVIARVHSFDDRSNLKVINNDILLTSTLHASSAYDDNQMIFRVKAGIYKNGLRLASVDLNGDDSVTLPRGVEYEVRFEIEYFDKIKAQYRLQLGQTLSVSDRYIPNKHHTFHVKTQAGNVERDYNTITDVNSRIVPNLILTEGTKSTATYIVPASESEDFVEFAIDFGFVGLIKNNKINADSTLLFTIDLS